MRSLSKEISSLILFLVELLIYPGFVIGYFFLVLHLLGDRLDHLFEHNKVYYAFTALALMVVQGLILERLTAAVMWVIQLFQAIVPALLVVARPQENVTRPKDAPGLLVYHFAGPLLAINADYFSRRVQAVISEADSPVTLFLINAEAIIDIDRVALETLAELYDTLKKKHIELGLCEVKGNFRKTLMRSSLPRRVGFNIYTSVAATMEHMLQEPTKTKK